MAHASDAKAIRGHGSPYDRGGADSYYRRPPSPHKMQGFARIDALTPEEILEYFAGFDMNELNGDHKEYT